MLHMVAEKQGQGFKALMLHMTKLCIKWPSISPRPRPAPLHPGDIHMGISRKNLDLVPRFFIVTAG